MKYLVRTNCEYSIELEARPLRCRLDLAATIPYGEWAQGWAKYEAEEIA